MDRKLLLFRSVQIGFMGAGVPYFIECDGNGTLFILCFLPPRHLTWLATSRLLGERNKSRWLSLPSRLKSPSRYLCVPMSIIA
jgi:hypothetical protein